MQNIKKIILCTIFFAQLYHYGFALDAAGVKAAKVLKEAVENSSDKLAIGGKTLAELLAKGSVEASSQLGIKAVTQLGVDGKAIADTLAQGSVEASSKLGVEAATEISKLGDKLAMVGQGVTIVYAGVQVWGIAKDVKSYVCPSQEDEARAAQAKVLKVEMKKKYEFLKAEERFSECLLKNAHSNRNEAGRPCACENLARLFAMAGGDNELEDMTRVFNKHYSKVR